MHVRTSKSVLGLFAVALTAFSAASAHAANLTLNTLLGGPIADGTNNGTDIDGNPLPGPVATPFLLFNAGNTGTVTSINSISLNLTHGYSGDVSAVLRYLPNGYSVSDPSAPFTDAFLFDQIGDDQFTFSNKLGGTYTFTNTGATLSLQQGAGTDNPDATVPAGSYLPTEFYVPSQTRPVVDLSAAFAGKKLEEGQFLVVLVDNYNGGSGTLTSASLNLSTVVPEPTSIAALGLAATLLRRRK